MDLVVRYVSTTPQVLTQPENKKITCTVTTGSCSHLVSNYPLLGLVSLKTQFKLLVCVAGYVLERSKPHSTAQDTGFQGTDVYLYVCLIFIYVSVCSRSD